MIYLKLDIGLLLVYYSSSLSHRLLTNPYLEEGRSHFVIPVQKVNSSRCSDERSSSLALKPAKRTPPKIACTKSSNTQRTENKTTDVVIHQHSRKLLKMDILMSETCWAHNKWNKIASVIKLVFHSSNSFSCQTHKLVTMPTTLSRPFMLGSNRGAKNYERYTTK